MSKVALVTGSAKGIGRAIIIELAKSGYDCVINYYSSEREAYELNDLIKQYNIRSLVLRCDVSNEEEVNEMFNTIEKELGGVDILINNAGLASGPTYNFDDETFDRIIAINVKGVYVCSKKAINLMKENGGGCIINTSSMVSRVGTPGAIVYPGSKFAVDGMTISLAREVGKDNIRVNCVAPGITETDMMAQAPKEIIAAMSKQVPLQRLGQPEDIANAFVFLASDYASYITGAVLRVDGGMLG